MQETQTNNTVIRIMTLRDASISGWAEATKKSELVKTFIEHEPYTAKQIQEANKFHKPLMKFGVIISKLIALEGQEIANRRKTIFEARYPTSDRVIHTLSDNWDYICQREELTTKLVKTMSMGLCYPIMGWLRRFIDIDDYGQLTFKYDVLDSFLVHPDCTFKKLNLYDCDYVAIDEWMTRDAINTKFKPNPFTALEIQSSYNEVQSRVGEGYYNSKQVIDGDKYLVVQHEDRVSTKLEIVDVNGQIMSLTKQESDRYANNGNKVDYIKDAVGTRIKVTSILPSHDLVLQKEEYKFDTSRFSFFPCASYDWAMEKRKQPSLMYLITDVQDSISKAKSQHADMMSQVLKEIYPINQMEDTAIKDLEANRGNPFQVVKLRNMNNWGGRQTGGGNVAALNAIHADMLLSLEWINEISNVTPAMEGKGGKSGESGALFDAKVERGLVATNPYYEEKSKCNLRLAQDYLELVKDVYFEDDRIVDKKRNNKGGLDFEIINVKLGDVTYNDVRTAKAQAVLDNGDSSPIQRDKTFNQNLAMIQTLLNAGYPPNAIDWTIIIENSNLKDKAEWIKMAQKGMSIQDMLAEEQFVNEKLAQEMPQQSQQQRQ